MRLLIPPPVILAIAALLMWLVARLFDGLNAAFPLQQTLVLLLVALGVGLMAASAHAFYRVRTTINPMTPDKASALITSGVYRLSRNPIYLADALLLAAFAVWLGNGLCVPILAGFIWYIDRFQIRVEEHALVNRFGAEYQAYREAVRRWI